MSSLVWGVGSTRNSRSLLKNSVHLDLSQILSQDIQNNIELEDESKDDPSFFLVTYSETVTDGVDYEVPDDREVENPTERLMITMDVSS